MYTGQRVQRPRALWGTCGPPPFSTCAARPVAASLAATCSLPPRPPLCARRQTLWLVQHKSAQTRVHEWRRRRRQHARATMRARSEGSDTCASKIFICYLNHTHRHRDTHCQQVQWIPRIVDVDFMLTKLENKTWCLVIFFHYSYLRCKHA